MNIQWRKLAEEINSHEGGYLLAVSGGVDSVFLLEFFRNKCARPFKVAHFNHKLRASSDEEERLVRERCREIGVTFIAGSGDPQAMRSAPSLEAEARRQRYEFLHANLDENDLVVTAHHANDQLETVIMRLMRGYPENALRMKRLSGRRYKPLLEIPKAEILKQAENRDFRWIEDESNEDVSHERNWVRHKLIPMMMERRNVLKTIGLRSEADHEEETSADRAMNVDKRTFWD
jgi:tRNA(Ile)-lysidine synthetase-like protein